MRKTNIQVPISTRDKLAQYGKKTDTYDDIILRMIHQRDILAIHEICRDFEDFNKGTVLEVFDTIDYSIPLSFTDYKDGVATEGKWESEEVALKWAMEMAQDEDFIGHGRELTVPVGELITNVYCLLEQIPAPTWCMSVRMKNPFKF